MEIKIKDKSEFLKSLRAADSVIAFRIHEYASHVLLEASPETGLVLTATDLEQTIRVRYPAEVSGYFSISVPSKKLSQIISQIRGTDITLKVGDDRKVEIKSSSASGKARTTLMGRAGEDFPKINIPPDNHFHSFPCASVIGMLRKTSYSMAEDDARSVFNGLCIQSSGNQTFFTATDGRRLAQSRSEFRIELFSDKGVIIPTKTVKELQSLMKDDGLIAYNEKDRMAFFRFGNIELAARLIEGQYPEYDQVIPKKQFHEVSISNTELQNALRQVSVMAAEPSRQILMKFSDNQLEISAATPDMGEAQDTIEINYEGEETVLAFNSHYVLDVLGALHSERIFFGFSQPASPATIHEPDDAGFVAVIMPMKI